MNNNLINYSDAFKKMANDILVFYRANKKNEIPWGKGIKLSFENNIEKIKYSYTRDFIISITNDRLTYGILYEKNKFGRLCNNWNEIMFKYYNLNNIQTENLNKFLIDFAPYIKKELARIHPDVEENNININIGKNQCSDILSISITWVRIENKVRFSKTN